MADILHFANHSFGIFIGYIGKSVRIKPQIYWLVFTLCMFERKCCVLPKREGGIEAGSNSSTLASLAVAQSAAGFPVRHFHAVIKLPCRLVAVQSTRAFWGFYLETRVEPVHSAQLKEESSLQACVYPPPPPPSFQAQICLQKSHSSEEAVRGPCALHITFTHQSKGQSAARFSLLRDF